MKKILGILGLLIFVCLFTTVLEPGFVGQDNIYNITRWSALRGILAIGVAFVIITGGIDLSVGSVVGLVGCLLPLFLVKYEWSIPVSVSAVGLIALGIGLAHGLLITKLKLQPFVVTLCGLLIYRGVARWWTEDQTQGFGQGFKGFRLLARGKPCSVATLVMVLGLLLAVWFGLGLLRAVWSKSERRGFLWTGLLFGISLAVLGSARFWHGYQQHPGPVLLTAGQYRVRAVAMEVPDEGVVLPQRLMRLAGIAVFAPAALVLIGSGMASRPVQVGVPLVLVAASVGLMAYVIYTLAPIYGQASADELWRVGSQVLRGETLKWGVLIAVFLIVALFMGSIAWLVTSILHAGGERAQWALMPALASGIIWLVGLTPLPATMVPMPMFLLIGLSIVAGIFLNHTIFGRYLLALGRNEEAARFSGINTDRMIILAYVVCSAAAGLGGILFALDLNSIQPSGHGNFYELYAIAAAVLGGCSLRGGEGTVLGVVIGAAVMQVLYNSINMLGISTQLEFAIIGVVILAGVIVDVVVKRVVAARRAAHQLA